MTIIRSIIVAAVGVLALVVASVAIAATDPRVCVLKSAPQCGKQAASSALRSTMSVRFFAQPAAAAAKNPEWTSQITCAALAGVLRFRCSFSDPAETGFAIVTFAPKTFRATVVVKSLVCVDPTRKGC